MAVAIPVLVPVIVPNVAVVFVGTRKTSSKLKGVVRLALLSGLRVNPNGLKFALVFVNVIPLPPQPDPADCEPVVVPAEAVQRIQCCCRTRRRRSRKAEGQRTDGGGTGEDGG